MKHNIARYIFIISILLVYAISAGAQIAKYRIHGDITDSSNGEKLPYISIRIRNTTFGCSSDNNGNFSFMVPEVKDTLIVSSIGYKEMRIPLNTKTKFPLHVKLAPDMYELSEITIKPKREKYSKKNNPAVELARKLIEHRAAN